MVEQCCRFVEQTPDLPIKLKLIDTLRTVTEGKVSYRWMFHYIYLLPSNWSQLFLLYLLFYLLTAPSVLLFFFHVLSPSPVTLLLSLSVSPSPYPPPSIFPCYSFFAPLPSSCFLFLPLLSHCLQIYVEVPRARLTMELSKIREAEGDIASAASILQELQVFIK